MLYHDLTSLKQINSQLQFSIIIKVLMAAKKVGTVKWFNPSKGFGFVQPEDGSKDVFVHISAVERAGLRTLEEGQRISFNLEDNRGKLSAIDLSVL